MIKMTWLLALALPATIISCQKDSVKNSQEELSSLQKVASPESSTLTGSGAPSGAHYTLNIVGVPKGKTADMTGNSGHRIFVDLVTKEINGVRKTSNIYLIEGTDFQVLDANATSGGELRGEFQMPKPYPYYNPETGALGDPIYDVYARPVGKPNGSATLTTCMEDKETLVQICSTENFMTMRTKGKPGFQNVTEELLTVLVDTDGDGTGDTRYPIFSDATQNYLWQYDNNGLKVLQLRFYPRESSEITAMRRPVKIR
jgi:hypothetical protein